MSRRILFVFWILAPLVVAQQDTWLEVRTPHFSIVTNSSETEGRRTARQFEAMRSTFQRMFPDAQLDTSEPMLVLAVPDKSFFRSLEPAQFLGSGQLNMVGFFLQAPEKNYVLVQLNVPGNHPYAAIYHEYAHYVFSRLHNWMPLWLSEGLAEFYQNTEILDGKIRLGKGDPSTQYILEHNALLPLETVFAVDQHSPYYHAEDKGSIFYAESWALTHYLKDKDDRENTHCLGDYIALLQQSSDPIAAAAQTFGDLTQLQQDLHRYVIKGEYALSDVPGSANVDDSSFTARPLPPARAKVLRAEFLAHAGRQSDARTLLDIAIHDDPTEAQAYTTLGYIGVDQGKFDDARKWCEQAIKLDPNNFAAHYWLAIAQIKKGIPDKAAQASVEQSLRTVIELNPSFIPAYDSLAVFFATRGIHLTEANELMQTAVSLGPSVPEVRVDQAQVLACMNKDKEAFELLDLALKMTHTPEQTAAVENVIQSLRKLDAERKQHPQAVVPLGRTAAANTKSATNSAAETGPKAIYAPQVEYTEEARNAKLQGTCVVALIVGVDGKPSNISVVKKLGMGLDQKAVEAVSRWRFEPARRYGHPVPTRLTLSLEFKLFGVSTQKFFELSQKAKGGDHAAELELAKAFLDGRDIPKDEQQGIALLERAARGGIPEAQLELADRTYADGNNPDRYIDAYVWYSLAQRAGADTATAKLAEVETRMTPDQLSEANHRLQAVQ